MYQLFTRTATIAAAPDFLLLEDHFQPLSLETIVVLISSINNVKFAIFIFNSFQLCGIKRLIILCKFIESVKCFLSGSAHFSIASIQY